VEFDASGDVSEYPPDLKEAMLAALADAAGLTCESARAIEVTAASVRVAATFQLSSSTAASAAAASISLSLGSAAASTTFFSIAGLSVITVVTAPTVRLEDPFGTGVFWNSPAPPPAPPAGLAGGGIVGGLLAVLLGAVAVGWGVFLYFCCWNRAAGCSEPDLPEEETPKVVDGHCTGWIPHEDAELEA